MSGLLIACDFDGTITQRDTLHVIIETFGQAGLWDALEPRMRSGEISVERAMEEEFAGVRASFDEVAALVLSEAPVRAGLTELARWAERAGHELIVVSAGFRSLIDLVLGEVGLGHLPIVSNEARFAPDGCRIEWRLPGGPCARCGRTCKRHAVAERRGARSVAYLGDGISDRCPALEADVVFARAGLARFLDEQGVSHEPLEDFHDVPRLLGRLAAAA